MASGIGNAILSSPSSSTYHSFVFLLLITAILTFTVPQHATSAAPTYLYTYCPNTLFSPNSSYQLDRDSLLSFLVASNNESVLGYRNATVGDDLPFNGISMCRGDVSESMCFTCISTAASNFSKRCPYGIQGLTWYDECLIRYSPSSLGTLDKAFTLYLSSTQNITGSLTKFNEILKSTSYDVAVEAAKGNEFRKFATKEAAYGDSQTIYVLGQCTPELSQTDCETCLKECVAQFPTCCSGKQGGRVIIKSCYIRYEIYLFYNKFWVRTPVPVPAPAPLGNRTGAASSGDGKSSSSSSSSKVIIVIIPVVGAATLVMLIGIACFVMARRKRKKITTYKAVNDDIASNDFLTAESLQYDFSTLQAVTDNFSDDNKIGEGGFGGVYKGTLPDGQEIAVKRLSRSSLQGVQEFKNEMVLVAKLQQRNLVRVLGFCLEGEEKLLVYKFVPNKSLDYFLFDPERQGELDWTQRYKIILGIARGMLYLHEDSRLRIIHRDLKASNVLLDLDMDPKISDFGMARIFGGEQTQGMTSRVVGTRGYMAPEYMLEGQYSIKSDVYSFGVLVLEIISGRKNSSFYRTGWAEDLLTYVSIDSQSANFHYPEDLCSQILKYLMQAWNLWSEGRPYDFMNITIKDSLYPKDEVKRCIQIGLLCVQKDPESRPTMAMVVHMLNMSSFAKLPLPQRPGFFVGGCSGKQPEQQVGGYGQSGYSSFPSSSTANDATISEVDPR